MKVPAGDAEALAGRIERVTVYNPDNTFGVLRVTQCRRLVMAGLDRVTWLQSM